MENLLPDLTFFDAAEYEEAYTHWNLASSLPPPSTPPRYRFLLSAPKRSEKEREQQEEEASTPPPPQLPLPEPNERYVVPVYNAASPSPLSIAERGQCEEFVLVLDEMIEAVAARPQRTTVRSGARRESKLSVWNMLSRPFTLFVQRKAMPASWEIAPNAGRDVLLLGDHLTKLDAAPVGLACCVAAVASAIRPALPDVTTVQIPFLPEQLGLHVQFLEAEQAVVVTGVLEDSQASDFEKYVLGSRILAVNEFAVSNLEDFGKKVRMAIDAGQDMTISVFPRFVSVPGVDMFDQELEGPGPRRTSYRSRQMSRRLGSFTSHQTDSPQPSPSRHGSSSNLGSDVWAGEDEYASLLAAKIAPMRNAPPAGWEFATGGGMEVEEKAATPTTQESLKIFADQTQRYLQNVPDHFYRSAQSDTACILAFSNFSVRHVMELYWCDYDGFLQRKATLLCGQSYRHEGRVGQVWLLVAVPRCVQTVAEYQRSLQSKTRKSSEAVSSGDVLLVQAHDSMISSMTSYTGMWAPTANNLSFVRRGRSASSTRSGQADAVKAEDPHLTVHLVCPGSERTAEPQR